MTSQQNTKVKVAIIGSGNIGTDLMLKIIELSELLELAILVGVDPDSEGLARAEGLGIATTFQGIDGLIHHECFPAIEIVFDATSAGAHLVHAEVLKKHGKQVIDLTPAAVGPYVVPCVNLTELKHAPNINMVTCGGQATIPIVAAVNQVAKVKYAEIVASIASKSAGPGTRANIDEFTETTAKAIETVGGAARGKAIIILNPAEPPLMMRDTVLCLCAAANKQDIIDGIHAQVAKVSAYVPGYRLKQAVQIEAVSMFLPETAEQFEGYKVSVLLEVEGAGHNLPSYAGNLDIMTSAALQTAEHLVGGQ